MSYIEASAIHKVYRVSSRLINFPKATWEFLILVARNTAAAIDTVHSCGHVIGDLNENNIFVNPQGHVSLLDCDSFQISANGETHLCRYGARSFTPPELQGKVFQNVQRTSNYDAFGLAVIIFQLLFNGRHPYAGVPTSPEIDGVTEKNIKAFRFAYADDNRARGLVQPPKAVPLTLVPEPMRLMFHRAFTEDGVQNGRPSAGEWLDALDDCLEALGECKTHSGHVYPNHLRECPWCVLEADTGKPFFPPRRYPTRLPPPRRPFDYEKWKKDLSTVKIPLPVVFPLEPPAPPDNTVTRSVVKFRTGAQLRAAARLKTATDNWSKVLLRRNPDDDDGQSDLRKQLRKLHELARCLDQVLSVNQDVAETQSSMRAGLRFLQERIPRVAEACKAHQLVIDASARELEAAETEAKLAGSAWLVLPYEKTLASVLCVIFLLCMVFFFGLKPPPLSSDRGPPAEVRVGNEKLRERMLGKAAADNAAALAKKATAAARALPKTLGMEFVNIKTGWFSMGSPTSEVHRGPDETQVRVSILNDFELGKTEVTQGQWQQVMGTEPWAGQQYVKIGKDLAATYVSWDDATAFCQKLTDLEHKAGKLKANEEYRLPTEAQWEYACRAGTTTAFSFGDDEKQLGEYAWFRGNTFDAGEQYAHKVGMKKSNPWGLFDMHGNVWEWCSDPVSSGGGSLREFSGGGWGYAAGGCRSAIRYQNVPSHRIFDLGFRVARSQKSP